jgi:hypothetical protein
VASFLGLDPAIGSSELAETLAVASVIADSLE